MPSKKSHSSLGNVRKAKPSKHNVSSLNLTRFCFKKVFEIGFINVISEKNEAELKNIITTCRKFEKLVKTTFICYEDVITFMTDFMDDPDKVILPKDVKEVLSDLVSEGMLRYKENLPIPTNVMARLIKIKLIHAMYLQYVSQVNKMKHFKRLEDELENLTKNLPSSQAESKGKKKGKGKKDKGKGKGTDKKSSKSSKSSGKKGKKGKEAQEKLATKKEKVFDKPPTDTPPEYLDYTTIPLSDHPLTKKRSFEDEIWFYCLSDFHDAHLLPTLVTLDVPLSFIIEFSHSGYAPSEDDKEDEEGDQFNNFWYMTDRLLYGPSRREELEGVIFMKYTASKIQNEEDKIDRSNLEEFIDVIKSIHDLRFKHLNYIENMKLYTLDHYNQRMTEYPKDFYFYNQFLNEFPFECRSIPIIVEGLLKQICFKFGENLGSYDSTPLQDLIISDEQPTENYCPCPFSFDYFIANNKEIPVEKILLQIREKAYSEETVAVKDSTFQIHEDNELELILRSYREIGRKVYDISLKHLKNVYPTFLIAKYDTDDTIELKHSHDRPDISCTIPDLSEEEIFHYITSLLLFRLQCQQVPPRKNEFCEINKNLKMKEPLEDYKKALPEEVIEDDILPYSKSLHKKICDRNLYELRLIGNYNWSEILSQAVLVQEILKNNDQFCCVDFMYCDEIKSLLVRYHNSLDEFGMNTRIWNQSLRTPICFRDFCRYVCREDVAWLQKQQNDLETSTDSLPQQNDADTKTAEPSSIIAAYNDYLEYLSPECDIESGALKFVSSQELLAKVLDYPRTSSSLREHCLKSGEFYSYIAYDLGPRRVEVNGSTTVFQSHDDVRIKVDTTHFLGSEKNFSIVISSENNDLIMHRNVTNFLLRCVTSDGVIIVIDKILEEFEILQSISELRASSYETFPAFNTFETTSASNVSRDEYSQSFSRIVNKSSVLSPKSSKKSRPSDLQLMYEHKTSKTTHSKVFSSLERLTEVQQKDLFAKHFFNIPGMYYPSENDGDELRAFTNDIESYRVKAASDEILQAVAYSIENDMSLHKMNVKDSQRLLWRKLEDLKIPIFIVVKRLLYKYAKKEKCKKYIRKYIPKNKDDQQPAVPNNKLDFKMTFPNGLTVSLVPSEVYSGHCEVKQQYLPKTHPKNIKHESYRLFTRNGLILIRYPDGRIDLLKSNGEIIQFEQPGNNEQSLVEVKHGVEMKNCFKLPSCKNLYNCQKQIANFLVDKYGDDSVSFISRRAHLHKQKAPAEEYITELSNFKVPYLAYSVLKFDGQRVKITQDHMTQKYECFMTHEFDHRLEEQFYIRDDGMRCLLERDRKLCIQFPDKSRISSWFDIEPELIYIDKKMGGWVSVVLNFKFEHPNYLTVIYKASCDDFDIIFNDHLTVKKTKQNNYEIDFNENSAVFLDNEELKFKKTCPECQSVFECSIDTGKFTNSFYNTDKDILVARDSYNKIFKVHDIEKYSTNRNFIRGPLNHNKCDHYSKMVYEKLIAIRNDYSGLLLWNNRNIDSKMKHFEKDPMAEVVTSTNFFGFKCMEFLKKIHQHYNNRFCSYNLTHNNVCLSRYLKTEMKSPEMVCLSYRELYEFGNLEKLQNIIMEIIEYIEKSGKLSLLPRELIEIVTLMIQNVNDREFLDMFDISSTTTEEVDDRPPCDCFKLRFTYGEKIEYWRSQCEKYKKYIRTSFVPIYFLSEYYKEPIKDEK